MKFNYGGQAVMEGVMMRGQKQMAVAVRAPNGEIILKTEPLNSKLYTSKIMKLPLLRGLVVLWDALVLGTRTLFFSANVAMLDPETPKGAEQKELDQPAISGWALWSTMAFSLVFAIALFFVGPLWLASLLKGWLGNELAVNLLEGLIRLVILLGYLWLMGRTPDVRRVFQYHGAEHKTINAYEAGVPLEPEKIQKFTTLHTRCGTSFLLLVVVISIPLFSLLGDPGVILKFLSRIVLVPVIAAFAYEYIKWSANHYGNAFVRALMQPGFALQRLTTREPELPMIETAVAALERVLLADGLLTEEEWVERRRHLPVYPAQPVRGEKGVAV